MAAEGVELVRAYFTLVPSMQGAQGTIAQELLPAVSQVGEEAGAAAGGKFGSGLKTAIAGAGIVGAATGAVKGLYEIGETFDDVTDTIRVGTGATGEQLDSLVQSAKNVGTSVPAEFSAIGQTVADVNTRLGLSGETLETVASQYLEAGRILGEDVDINQTSAAFNAFQIQGEGVVGAMDTLFQVSQATGVGVNELASTVQTAAPALQNLGFSFEESASLAGSLDKAGLNTSAVMGSLSKGLVTLAKDGEEPQEAFRRITGELQSLVDAGDVAGAIDLASGIFGTRGAAPLVGAVQSGQLALDDLVAATGATGDTILGVGEDTADFAEKWQVVKNQALAAMEPLASGVFNALGSALETLMPYLASFGEWLGENTWVLGTIATVIGVTLVGAFIAWTASIWAATIALLANPVTWIIVGIVALIAALVLLIANWDTVVAWIGDVFATAVQWVKDLFASIGDWFEEQGARIGAFLSGLWEGIVTTAEELWGNLVDFVKGIPQSILDGLAALGDLAARFWDWVMAAKDAAVDRFMDMVTWVGGIPGRILDALGDLGSLLVDAGKNILSGFLDGLKSGFENVKNFVGGIGDWIADHKGPKAYDLGLLVPAGGWIMDGLQDGLKEEIPALRRTMAAISSEINVTGPVSNPVPLTTPDAGRVVQYNTINYPVAEPESIAQNRALQYASEPS